ncbi:MAG: hypothetical protein AAF391_00565 [Bacteroidota bacterium]
MKNRRFKEFMVLVLSAALTFSCAQEDTESLGQAEIYLKYYGSDRAEVFFDMIRTGNDDPSTPEVNEAGFIMLGSTSNTLDGSRDILLVGADYAGNRTWQIQYDNFTGDDVPSNLRLSSDSTRVYVVGTANFNTDDESFLFIDADVSNGVANSIFRVQYDDTRININNPGTEVPDTVRTRGADVIELDNSFLFLGSAQTGTEYRSDVNNYSVLVFSLDIDTYDTTMFWPDLPLRIDDIDGSNSGNDFGVKLNTDEEKYFYLAKSEDPTDGLISKVMINNVDLESGQAEADAPRFGISGTNVTPTNFIINNQNLVVTGTAGANLSERAFFLAVNKSLTNTDEQVILVEDPNQDVAGDGSLDGLEGSKGQDIVRLRNGDYYIIGQFNNYTNEFGVLKQNEIALIRVDDLGNVIPEGIRVFGSDGNDQGNAILLDGADEDVIIGATMDFGGVATMLALMKTNVNGELKD